MLVCCALPGCHGLGFVRDNGTDRKWYCSVRCSRLARHPVHWQPEGSNFSACRCAVTRWIPEHRYTSDLTAVSCGNCVRSKAYKAALAA